LLPLLAQIGKVGAPPTLASSSALDRAPAKDDAISCVHASKKDSQAIQMQGTPTENALGLMQWLMIGTFVLYYGTYCVDFWLLAQLK